MKKTAKLLAFLLAALLLATASLTAYADNALPPEKGNLHIHKYIMPDLAQAGAPNDGTTGVTLPATADPIGNIVFKVYKINASFDPHTSTAPLNEITFVLDNYDNPTKITTSASEVFTLAGLSATVTTNASGLATASNLDQGFYLVVEQIDAANRDAIASVVFPFIVAVPMTNKDGDGWLQDVHVYPKNGDISITKSVDRNAVQLGEEVTWTIVVSVPADITHYKQFDVTDQLDTSLDYLADTLKVYGMMTEAEAGTLVAQTGGRAAVAVDATNKLTLSFSQLGRDAIAAYKFIRIELVTKTNQNILDRAVYTVENSAKVEFQNKFDSVSRVRETPKVRVHSAAIQINKVDANNANAPLPNAQFQIASSEANAKNGRFIKKITVGGKVSLVDYGQAGWDTAADWVVTSTGAGIVLFDGLKAYLGMKTSPTFLTYWIVETKAPDNYNLLAAPIVVTFSAANLGENNLVSGITCTNTNKFTLPKTGGTGTILFTAGGVSLILVAAFLLLMGARKKKEKAR